MTIFRFISSFLPQLLLLLLLGGYLDLLGGWNHTHSGFISLLILFLVSPIFTQALLIIEIIRFRKLRRQSKESSLLWLVVALFLCLETLSINLLILSQVRM